MRFARDRLRVPWEAQIEEVPMETIKPTDVTVLPQHGRRWPGSGRTKGARNKMTRLAKEAIALAFEEHGGVKKLVEWIQKDPKNERDFYLYVYPKLLPLEVKAELSSPVIGLIKFRGINADRDG